MPLERPVQEEAASLGVIFNRAEPECVTIIPTYRCNAACSECCFESNPSIRHRMTRDKPFATIRKAHAEFPGLRYVVLGDRAFARELALRPATALVSKYTDLAERTFQRRR